MPQATLATVNGMLKEVYEGKIQAQYNDDVTPIKRIEKSSDGVTSNVGGKYVTFPIRVSRNHGISYRAENTPLAAALAQGYAAVQVPLLYGYGRIRITGQMMELADSNPQAFASAMDTEMQGIQDDLRKDSARIVYGDTNNGAITYISDTTTSATHAVTNVNILEVNMLVDVLVGTTGSATGGGTSLTISAVDYVAGTVTFSGSIGATTTGHAIFRAGNRGLEPTGLAQIVASSGTLHNVNPASQPRWVANVNSNSGTNRPLSEGLMITIADQCRFNGGDTSVIFTSLGVRRAYFNLLTQQRRYTDTKQFAGGFQGLAFNYGTEVPVVDDVNAPKNKMWFLDESKLKIFRNKAWYWADDDGSVLKYVHDYDAWEALMKQYWEFATTQRNTHGLLSDITEG